MTRQNSHSVTADEPDATCRFCCCDVGCHNPCEGCCDYITDCIWDCVEACCDPIKSCIKSLCGGFAYIWYTFGWVLQYLATLGYTVVFGFVCYYAFTCKGTSFTCDKATNTCSSDGKDPIDGAWTPDLIAQLCCVGALCGLVLSQTYILGICGGYFDQPFDKSTLKIEHSLWMTCKHVLKYFWILPITATSFVLKSGLDANDYGNYMGMCYNNQLGGFLWGTAEVATMAQIGSYAFLGFAAIMVTSFGCMRCAKSARFLCIECHCFTEGCYEVLCWGAISPIWIGVPAGIVFQVSAFFITFMSPGNAIIALMAVSDFGYMLQYICAYAAPEGSRARRQYEDSMENQETGNEAKPMVDVEFGGRRG